MIGLLGIMCRIFVFSAAVRQSGGKGELHLPLAHVCSASDVWKYLVSPCRERGKGDEQTRKYHITNAHLRASLV